MTANQLAAIQKTCCFTGHRDIKLERLAEIEKRLEETVSRLIAESGMVNFIAGGALGFDTLAAECVLSLKERYPQIRLLLALPCPEQTLRWKAEDVARYEKILAACDKYIYVSERYTPACMHERNRFLVDHSNLCIAYRRADAKGGTAYTLAYAQKKGIRCINLCQENE